MATTQFRNPKKAAVHERAATDDQIFKKLNRTINGLEKPINKTATIQTHPEAIKPDGTIAQTDDDIKLIEGKPIRTPRGVLEYREEKEDETEGLTGSIRVIKNSDNVNLFEIKTDDGWKKPMLGESQILLKKL